MPLALHQFAKKYQVPCMLISLHWPTVIHDHLKDKAHGGPFETPFKHADEAEASCSLALFPPGQLPPASKTTMRDLAELEARLKGPLNAASTSTRWPTLRESPGPVEGARAPRTRRGSRAHTADPSACS